MARTVRNFVKILVVLALILALGSVSPSPTAAGCTTSSNGAWQNVAVPTQTGTFTVEFNATPNNANLDGAIGLSNGSVSAYTSLAAIPRFYTNNLIDARNGSTYQALTQIPYSAGTAYHFRLNVNIPTHTYSAYVKQLPSGTEQTIGTNFAFRTEQANVASLNNLAVIANTGTGSLSVCNVTLSTSPNPSPSPTPTPGGPTPSPIIGNGDADGNGVVNILDIRLILNNWLLSLSNSINQYKDSKINSFDFAVVAKNIPQTASPSPTRSPSPTPTRSPSPTPAGATPTPTPTGLPSPSFSTGVTYYVSPSGSDTNPGTLTQPFKTIAKAISVAGPGNTIFIRQGVYGPFSVSKSGSSGALLTVSGFPGENILIDAGGTSYGVQLANVSYVQISNLEATHATGAYKGGIYINGGHHNVIKNVKSHDNLGGANTALGIRVFNSSFNLIEGNETYNNSISGINIETSSGTVVTGNQVIGNRSYNNTQSGGNSDGFNQNGVNISGTLIKDNIVYGNADDGIDTWRSSGNIIEGNVVYNQRGSGDGNGIKAGGSTTGGNNIVRFNISYNNKRNGFDSNGSGGNKYYHNVAYANGRYGFEDGFRNSGSTGCPDTLRCYGLVINNIGFNNASGNYSAGSQTKTSDYNLWFQENSSAFNTRGVLPGLESHSIKANPQFVNTATADFHLRSTSPAINSGDPANPLGVSVCDSRVDIGRFEYCAIVF